MQNPKDWAIEEVKRLSGKEKKKIHHILDKGSHYEEVMSHK